MPARVQFCEIHGMQGGVQFGMLVVVCFGMLFGVLFEVLVTVRRFREIDALGGAVWGCRRGCSFARFTACKGACSLGCWWWWCFGMLFGVLFEVLVTVRRFREIDALGGAVWGCRRGCSFARFTECKGACSLGCWWWWCFGMLFGVLFEVLVTVRRFREIDALGGAVWGCRRGCSFARFTRFTACKGACSLGCWWWWCFGMLFGVLFEVLVTVRRFREIDALGGAVWGCRRGCSFARFTACKGACSLGCWWWWCFGMLFGVLFEVLVTVRRFREIDALGGAVWGCRRGCSFARFTACKGACSLGCWWWWCFGMLFGVLFVVFWDAVWGAGDGAAFSRD